MEVKVARWCFVCNLRYAITEGPCHPSEPVHPPPLYSPSRYTSVPRIARATHTNSRVTRKLHVSGFRKKGICDLSPLSSVGEIITLFLTRINANLRARTMSTTALSPLAHGFKFAPISSRRWTQQIGRGYRDNHLTLQLRVSDDKSLPRGLGNRRNIMKEASYAFKKLQYLTRGARVTRLFT